MCVLSPNCPQNLHYFTSQLNQFKSLYCSQPFDNTLTSCSGENLISLADDLVHVELMMAACE